MDIKLYYILLISFYLAVLLFNKREISYANNHIESSQRKYIYWIQIILFIGIIIRTIYLSVPIGLNADEAMSGYNSWCLLHYGEDMHLASYPVYLKAWGSGMNALYAYIAMPFIKLFGLSLPVFRLPMALISSASLLILYYTLRKTQKDYFFILIIILFMVISPWHIMKSRWALESNLAPDLILIGVCLLILGYYNEEIRKARLYFASGFAFIAASAYGYAVTWFMLPFFCLFLFIFFYKEKRMGFKDIAIYIIELLVLTLPLILFAIVLVTKGEQFQLGPITITSLDSGRHDETTVLGSATPLVLFIKYMKKGLHILIFGDDFFRWNSFFLFGQFYNIISIPFALVAFYILRKKAQRNLFDNIFAIWLVATLPIILLVEPNVNHWNMLWFPLIYFTARGIHFCATKIKFGRALSLAVMIILFAAFSRKYITFYSKVDSTYMTCFLGEIDEYIEFTKAKELDRIYFNELYPFALFYDPVSPYLFNATKKTKDGSDAFDTVAGYCNYRFSRPEVIEPAPKTAYILRSSTFSILDIELSKFHIKKGEAFVLLWTD